MILYYAIPGLKYRQKITFAMLPDHIIDTTCQIVGFSREEVFARSRSHRMVMIRAIMMRLLRDKTRLSLKDIAAIFGMDHSNIINSIKALNLEMGKSEVPEKLIEQIKSQLKY